LSLNKKEIDEKIIELHREGKTVREIAKIVHKSFSYICDVIRKYNEQKARENHKGDSNISVETKAVDLFSQGKNPIEVKILLDITTDEVETHYQSYWKLNGLHQLCKCYETEIKNKLPSFLNLYSKVRELGISNSDVVSALRYINDIPLLELACRDREKKNKNLEIKQTRLISELDELEASINKFKNSFE
jgi:transposase